MNITVNLPVIIEVSDYHEFDDMERAYKKLNPCIKIKELGFNMRYIGIAYFGSLNEPNAKSMIDRITKQKGFEKLK
jgi:hypothetical protein